MNVEIPAEFTAFVQGAIRRGEFASETEIVIAGLRLLREREQRLESLRAEILPAIEELDRGEGKPLDIEQIIARCHAQRVERLGNS